MFQSAPRSYLRGDSTCCATFAALESQSRMSDEDFARWWSVLHRYAEFYLDHWDLWRLPAPFGEVFIATCGGAQRPGLESAGYDDLTCFPTRGSSAELPEYCSGLPCLGGAKPCAGLGDAVTVEVG